MHLRRYLAILFILHLCIFTNKGLADNSNGSTLDDDVTVEESDDVSDSDDVTEDPNGDSARLRMKEAIEKAMGGKKLGANEIHTINMQEIMNNIKDSDDSQYKQEQMQKLVQGVLDKGDFLQPKNNQGPKEGAKKVPKKVSMKDKKAQDEVEGFKNRKPKKKLKTFKKKAKKPENFTPYVGKGKRAAKRDEL